MHGMIRGRANRPSMDGKHDSRSGPIPPEQMTRLQQLGGCDDAMAVPGIAGEVHLYQIIRGRYGRNQQHKQPKGADDAGQSKAFPWQGMRADPSMGTVRC